jgi:hypothetical protein
MTLFIFCCNYIFFRRGRIKIKQEEDKDGNG